MRDTQYVSLETGNIDSRVTSPIGRFCDASDAAPMAPSASPPWFVSSPTTSHLVLLNFGPSTYLTFRTIAGEIDRAAKIA
jgi:hypothetical protein